MTKSEKIREEEIKKELRKTASELLNDRYFLSFVCKDKMSSYKPEIKEDIPKIKEILNKVRKDLNICINLKSRNPHIICQRYALIYHLRVNLKFRTQSIAHVITNKDPTIISHACKKVSDFLDIKDDMYEDMLEKIKSIV